ncbi:MAG TPA: choice-of-anchor D domain-containing protein [Candidatus Kapabacteria bacterium]|nr:choice-of-anchor D domain-containing protein [Candidatus Kapabacteria bacterium]
MQLTVGVDMYLQVSGAFSLFNGQAADGIDAAYTYRVPNWNIFTPIPNPPSHQKMTFNWGFEYSNNGGGFKPFYNPNPPVNTPVYQNSHNYTARIPFLGNKFAFHIVAPSPSYLSAGTGKLFVKLTRFTAGLCVKSDSIDFKQVKVSQTKPFLDSLSSYGIDPLLVDSIKIIGSSDFTFVSSRPIPFSLAPETASQLIINATPSTTGVITAQLHIYCHNADALNKDRIIKLRAEGTSPNGSVGPDSLNFGKVRINYPATKAVNISNAGSASLSITSDTYNPADNIFKRSQFTNIPLPVGIGSTISYKTVFAPQAIRHYHATLKLASDDSKTYSVDLQGDGAEPVPVLSTKFINFGSVFKGDSVSSNFTLKNTGNWTCSVVDAHIESANKSVFSFSPAESTFFVEPDSIRTITVSFKPGTGQNWLITGNLILVYDDNTRDTVVLNGTEVQPKYLLKNHLYDFGKVRIGSGPQLRAVDTISAPTTPVTMSALELKQPQNFFGLGNSPQSHQTFTVVNGSPVQLWASFEPLVPGPWSTYMYVNDGYKKDSIELRGIGAVAKAIFSPNPLSFGTVPSDTNIDSVTTLTDSGDYQLNIVRYEITGPDRADFKLMFKPQGQTPTFPYALMEGSSMPIDVRFYTNAKTGLVHRATLCLYYDDSSSDCIPLEAIEEAQFLQFGQTSVDFGKVRVGLSGTMGTKFANKSGKTLTVDTISTDPNPLFTASRTSLSVDKGVTDSVSVAVTFAPTLPGDFTGTLTGKGGDFIESSISLRGTGAAPIPVFSLRDTVDCGVVKLFDTGTGGFQLLNLGNWTLAVANIQIVGDKYNEFSYKQGKTQSSTATIDTVLEKGLPSDYQISFTPNKTIVYHEAKMVFTFDDGTKGVVVLQGYDESDHLVLGSDTLNFGKVRIGKPVSRPITLVSTSTNPLTADNVHLEGAPEFTAAPLGKITVAPKYLQDIDVTCTPTIIGALSAQLITDTCLGSAQDTTFIFAEGAMPIASFPSDTLDFGLNFNGRSVTKTIDLTNKGNWDLAVTSYTIGGNESSDFTTPTIPQAFTIAEQSDSVLSITFKASTAFQVAPRIGEIDFTLDDGSIFTLYLKAQDIQPIEVDLKFDNSNMRLEDKVYPYLRLMTAIPDSLNVNHIHGIVKYDPAVVSAPISVEESAMLQQNGWTLTPAGSNLPGQYEYDLQSATGHLSAAGPLLRFEFKAANGAQVGDQTVLNHSILELPTRTEFVIQERQGIIVIDSACGSTHLLQGGKAQANYIEMNSPNPFGNGTLNESTNMTFAIANDGTPVTLRVLDISGKEVLRPLDQQVFAQGYFKITLSANDLPNSGTYLYEFRAGNERPTVRKMIVRK